MYISWIIYVCVSINLLARNGYSLQKYLPHPVNQPYDNRARLDPGSPGLKITQTLHVTSDI